MRAVYAKKRPGAYLTERAATGQKRLAIVLDIDNTSLATHYAWPAPIKRTLKLTRKAESRGMAVVFVTGRFEDGLADVTKALDAAGYHHHDGICGRRHGEAIADGKQRCRASTPRRAGPSSSTSATAAPTSSVVTTSAGSGCPATAARSAEARPAATARGRGEDGATTGRP
ncbi:hypothetical protein [Nocardioides kongjuensis]|uniref:hypothetical protein n=1 Tax=Nocardioides kongjuensis TaxID=349522 RepID=UPI0031ECC384